MLVYYADDTTAAAAAAADDDDACTVSRYVVSYVRCMSDGIFCTQIVGGTVGGTLGYDKSRGGANLEIYVRNILNILKNSS